jgi:hypothetical protein
MVTSANSFKTQALPVSSQLILGLEVVLPFIQRKGFADDQITTVAEVLDNPPHN